MAGASEISKEFLDMVKRDFSADVSRINSELNLKGQGLLVNHIPPHTFVGDIDIMESDNCILVIGINPFLSDSLRFQKSNIDLPKRCLKNYHDSNDTEALVDWINWQKGYFLSDDINAKHFKKIAKLVGPRFFPTTFQKDNWQETLSKHVVEVDVIPYYSEKASINGQKLANLFKHDPALVTHLQLIKWIIGKIQPKWIMINGKTGWDTVCQELLNGKAEKINHSDDKGSEIMVGHTNIEGKDIPVLMHKQIGGRSGANSHIQRNQVMDSWERWLSIKS